MTLIRDSERCIFVFNEKNNEVNVKYLSDSQWKKNRGNFYENLISVYVDRRCRVVEHDFDINLFFN